MIKDFFWRLLEFVIVLVVIVVLFSFDLDRYIVAALLGVALFLYDTLFRGDKICSEDVAKMIGLALLFLVIAKLTAWHYHVPSRDIDDHKEIFRWLRFSLWASYAALVLP